MLQALRDHWPEYLIEAAALGVLAANCAWAGGRGGRLSGEALSVNDFYFGAVPYAARHHARRKDAAQQLLRILLVSNSPRLSGSWLTAGWGYGPLEGGSVRSSPADWNYPMGHISFVGKLDRDALRGGAPAIAPGFTLEIMAHELDNLYVVDGSFFPSCGAVNPGLTIMANAIRVGDLLIERMK